MKLHIEWLVTLLITGVCLASIAAHPRILNLDLVASVKIGLVGGVLASLIYLIIDYTTNISNIVAYILSLLGLLTSGIGLVMWSFFRDPERIPVGEHDAVIAPADGKIIYVREIVSGTIPCAIKGKRRIEIKEIVKTGDLGISHGYIIGISMSVLDVHVTRAPIDGRLIDIQSFSGRTISPKDWTSEIENPRTTLVFEDGACTVIVVEMGTPYVSRILSYINKNSTVKRGQRIGRITWGSQVDVIVPSTIVDVLVREGDYVTAGQTILAKLPGSVGEG
jgi:phosphatidylserine decarboxylase